MGFLLFSGEVFGYHQGFLLNRVVPIVLPAGHPIRSQSGVCAGLVHFWIKNDLEGGDGFKTLKKLIDQLLISQNKKLFSRSNFEELLKKNKRQWRQKKVDGYLDDISLLQKKLGTEISVGSAPRIQYDQIANVMAEILTYKSPESNGKCYWEISVRNEKDPFGHAVAMSMNKYEKGIFYDPNFGLKKIKNKIDASKHIENLIKKEKGSHRFVFKRVTKEDLANMWSQEKRRTILDDRNSFSVR